MLKIQITEQEIVRDASISLPEGFYKYGDMQLSTAEDVIKAAVGSSCFQLTMDMLYFLYSQNRFYAEVELLKARYNVDTSHAGVLKVGFPGGLGVEVHEREGGLPLLRGDHHRRAEELPSSGRGAAA